MDALARDHVLVHAVLTLGLLQTGDRVRPDRVESSAELLRKAHFVLRCVQFYVLNVLLFLVFEQRMFEYTLFHDLGLERPASLAVTKHSCAFVRLRAYIVPRHGLRAHSQGVLSLGLVRLRLKQVQWVHDLLSNDVVMIAWNGKYGYMVRAAISRLLSQ